MIFKPWIGQRYENRELFGLRVLLLGESHYGESGEENYNFTIDVVKHWGQERRHSFFTITAKFVLGKGAREWISDEERKHFWEKVAFYNYVQELVGNDSRIRPTEEMWESAKTSFLALCEELKPELVIVLGKELCWNLPEIPSNYTYCCVRHPSSGFSYKKEMPTLLDAIATAQKAFNNQIKPTPKSGAAY